MREGLADLIWAARRGGGLCWMALPTGTKVESGTSQSKSETSVNLSNSGKREAGAEGESGPRCDY